MIFPEIDYSKVEKLKGMNITTLQAQAGPRSEISFLLQNIPDELMPRGQLGAKVFPSIDRRIDFAAELRLGIGQCSHGFTKPHVADHEHVHVAASPLLGLGH